MLGIGRFVLLLAGIIVWSVAAPANAQINMDSGKSAAQIFATTCNACHRSAREIKPTNAGFLREHYTAGRNEAAAMAAYLAAVGSDPNAVKQRPRPAMGVGQPVHAERTDQDKGSPPAGPKPRRPSDSFEVGKLSDAALTETTAAVTPTPPAPPLEAIEE